MKESVHRLENDRMIHSLAVTVRLVALAFTLILTSSPIILGQLKVQAGISNPSGGTIHINAKPSENITAQTFSAMNVTVAWDEAYGIDLGAVTSGTMTTSESMSVSKQGGEVASGGKEYQIFSCIPGAGTITWTADSEYFLFSVDVSGGSGTGTVEILNDSYTLSNNGDWYFEVGGVEVEDTDIPFYQSSVSGVALPVQLATFSASLGELRKVELEWTTASEIQTNKFVIKRRWADEWMVAGEVEAAGTSTSEKFYKFSDQLKTVPAKSVFYKLEIVNSDGSIQEGPEEEVPILPIEFALEQNYPNPFNPETRIQYALPKDAHVDLEVYDITGRRVLVVLNEEQKAGIYEHVVPGNGLSSGMYIYRMLATAEGRQVFAKVRKMVLIR